MWLKNFACKTSQWLWNILPMSNGLEHIFISQKVDCAESHQCSTSQTPFIVRVLLCHHQRKMPTLPLLNNPLCSINEISTGRPLGMQNNDFKHEIWLVMTQKIWIQIFQNSESFQSWVLTPQLLLIWKLFSVFFSPKVVLNSFNNFKLYIASSPSNFPFVHIPLITST